MSQFNIYDYKGEIDETGNVPILLHKGDKVYLVDRADITECAATGSTWLCGQAKQHRGYKVVSENGDMYFKFDYQIGDTLFTNLTDAQNEVQKYIDENRGNIILASEIKPIEITAYSLVKDDEELLKYACNIGNNRIYTKNFNGEHYIFKGEDFDMDDFKTNAVFEKIQSVEINPHFKNMYKCVYSQAEYADISYPYLR